MRKPPAQGKTIPETSPQEGGGKKNLKKCRAKQSSSKKKFPPLKKKKKALKKKKILRVVFDGFFSVIFAWIVFFRAMIFSPSFVTAALLTTVFVANIILQDIAKHQRADAANSEKSGASRACGGEKNLRHNQPDQNPAHSIRFFSLRTPPMCRFVSNDRLYSLHSFENGHVCIQREGAIWSQQGHRWPRPSTNLDVYRWQTNTNKPKKKKKNLHTFSSVGTAVRHARLFPARRD
jgi:hypothetical protein